MTDDLVAVILEETREKMTKAAQHTRQEFSSIRTGRAAPALVEKIPVDYYGTDVPLQQLAGFSVPEARTLVISPYDKGAMPGIEKALRSSDLGLNPSNDGTNIRLTFPPLTAERRKEFVRVVKQMAEDGRVKVRNLRRSARHDMGSLEKDGELSQDELQRGEKELDRITHAEEAEIDRALENKEQELLQD